MSKLNEIIVLQLPIQSEVKPCTAYLLDNGDGTHDRYVSDEDGNLSKLEGGIKSIQAGTNITIDNTDPKNPIISSTGGTYNEIDPIFSASPAATIQETDIYNWNNPKEVSNIQKGIVNNISLQELGGVDKKINNVRIGTGNGSDTEWSIALGRDALTNNTTGKNNNAVGRDSLRLNTTGSYNTGVGDYTLSNNTTGSYNTFIGTQSGNSNTSAINNTGFGAYSLGKTTTGSKNTAIGHATGYNITTGTLNFIAGNDAGYNITTGSQNVCIGQQAGKTITTGSQNICIGGASGTSTTGVTTASGSIANGISNIFLGTNIGLYGGLTGVNNSHYLIIHNYRNDGVAISDPNNPLIKGHFVDRWLTVSGKFSVLPAYMPNATGNSAYTKDIVAKPDGTFGWDDRFMQTIQTVTSVFGDNTSVRLIRTGKEVTLNFNKYVYSTELTTALGTNSFITLFTLPTGYRPSGEIRLPILTHGGFRLARIFSTGEVLFYPSAKEDGSTTTESPEGYYNLNITFQVP